MFQGARDSYVDLLEIKAKKEDESKKKLTKTTTSSTTRRERIVDNLLNGNTEKRHTSFKPSKKEPQSINNNKVNITYEPVEIDEENEDDINWLIWEMTTSNPWRDNIASMEERVTSIAACERIFTVPEVYDELQCGLVSDLSSLILRNNTSGTNDSEEGPCSNILHCLNPWKQQPQMTASNAFQDNINPQEQPQDLLQRSSMAVSNYLNLPPSKRKVYIPSMFNTTTDNRNNEHKAHLKGCMKHPSSSTTSTTTSATKPSKPKYKRVHFSEIKRILRIKKFTPKEQVEVWYQKVDFDYFKNEMTLLIQQDGASRELAQVWLEAQACESSSRRGSSSDEGSGSDNEDDKQHQHHQPTRRHNRDDSNSSTKWWHNYDHSRRGLERYASPGQAKQILASYKIAVKKVLGEQQRQRLLGCLFFIPGVMSKNNNVEKIAEIYHSYTSWSRDLALAAGASDADAVRTNFDENKRHTREYYLLKQIVASGNLVHKHMPQFMLPKCIKPKGFIDESKSLHSTIQMRPRGLGKRSVSVAGKEAREEMSRLDNNDVISGPVSPMLASLQVNSADHDLMGFGPGSVGSRASSRGGSEVKKSMAEKAKNYPFQH